MFLDILSKELRDLKPTMNHPCNLSPLERSSLMSLQRNDKIVIKISDKGANIVVLDTCSYKEMCLNILQDRECYEVLPTSPTGRYKEELKTILDDALEDKVISKQESHFLLPACPVIATFYGLPKIHKGYNPLKGRPILSGINSLTQNAGIYVDKILKTFVTAIPSYTKDTSDVLRKCDGITVDDKIMLGSIDVESLYSSIPHAVGYKAIPHFLDTRGTHFQCHNIFVLKLLRFILERNYFAFDQLMGTAMGRPCAPT